MSIPPEELQAIAKLAYLDSGKHENQALIHDVNAILDFVQQLQTIDTTGIAPLFHPFDLHQRLREDEVTEADCRAQLAEIAPLFEDGLYLVPKVIETGS